VVAAGRLSAMAIRGKPVRLVLLLCIALLAMLAAACGGSSASSSEPRTITLYTCVNDTTVGPVIDGFKKANPGSKVRLFRAPTGNLNARVAGDVRSGGLRADVVWACDPLTMDDYVKQGLVGGWTASTSIPARYRTRDAVGVAVLYLVAVTGKGVPTPAAWSDLTGPQYSRGVAVPDPGLAASALGALGYFASNRDYGTRFYATLRKDGAKQVSTPDDVVAGVAEGTYAAGITIANSAYAAQKSGSPIKVTWPEPGAVAVYGPIALVKDASHVETAKRFITYVASAAGQRTLARAGSYPTMTGVPGPPRPKGAPVVSPDWDRLSSHKDALLAKYQKIFGG
jgi:iron(III) transport system substrate-binding protein